VATDKSIPVCFHRARGIEVGLSGKFAAQRLRKAHRFADENGVLLKAFKLRLAVAGVAGKAPIATNDEMAKLEIESHLPAADRAVLSITVTGRRKCRGIVEWDADSERLQLVELVLEIDLAGVLADVEMVPSRAGIEAGVKAAPIERLLWGGDMLKNIPSCASVRRSGKREN